MSVAIVVVVVALPLEETMSSLNQCSSLVQVALAEVACHLALVLPLSYQLLLALYMHHKCRECSNPLQWVGILLGCMFQLSIKALSI
jgi:collagenase-like PrtC family protease